MNLTNLEGFRAAAKSISDLLDGSKVKSRCSKKSRNSVAYKHGYEHGLLVANCLLILGEYPNHPTNKTQILKALPHLSKWNPAITQLERLMELAELEAMSFEEVCEFDDLRNKLVEPCRLLALIDAVKALEIWGSDCRFSKLHIPNHQGFSECPVCKTKESLSNLTTRFQ